MPISISHVLSATTPDDPAYEIRPSHWNSLHALTLAIVGTDISGAFSNAGNVSFGLDAGGNITASANVTAAPSPVNVTGANGSSVNAQTIAFSNANGLSLGVSTAANGATVTGSYTVPSTAGHISAVNVSAGTTSQNLTNVVFSNSGGVSFGLNGSTITATVATNYQSQGAYLTTARASNDAVGLNTAQSNVTWTVNSSGLSLDARGYAGTGTSATNASVTLNSNGLAISVGAGGAGDGVNIIAAGTQTANTTGSVLFQNSNGITFGMSNSSVVTASYTVPTVTNSSWTVSDNATSGTVGRLAFTNLNGVTLSLSSGTGGLHTIVGSHNALTSQSNQAFSASGGSSAFQTLNFANSNGFTFSNSNGSVIASYTVPTQSVQTVGLYASSQTTGASSSSTVDARSISIVGAGNISVGLTGGSFVISQTGGGGGVTPVASASNGSFSFTTLAFSNANNVTFGTSAGSIVTASVAAPGAAAENNWVNLLGANTGGNTSASGSTIGWSGINLTLSGTNNSVVNISAPATSSLAGASGIGISTNGSTISVYNQASSYFEPYPLISSTAMSSHAPASWYFNRFTVNDPVICSHINFGINLAAAAPAATSVASTGTLRYSYSKGMTLFTRQDYGANSTNLTQIATASFGLTAGLSYSSTSQSLVVSYVTDSTGGTTSFNTTSNSSGWVSFLSGSKIINMPFITTLTDGEYFVAHNHSSTTGTTQSNVTLMSVSQLHQAWPALNFGVLGSTQTFASLGVMVGEGVASAVTTNNTMPMSAISQQTRNILYMNFINASN
jgi:hypothetical protein